MANSSANCTRSVALVSESGEGLRMLPLMTEDKRELAHAAHMTRGEKRECVREQRERERRHQALFKKELSGKLSHRN